MNEQYPINWKHATIHVNPETGEMHFDAQDAETLLILHERLRFQKIGKSGTMDITILYRLDEEEEYRTDTTILRSTTWPAVLAEIQSIEGHATVLEIKRMDVK
jgi:hypothetical protein